MAITTLSLKVKTGFEHNITKTASNKSSSRLTDSVDQKNASNSFSFTLGTGASQCDQLYQDKRTLSASTGEDLNLSGGSHSGAVALTNPFGEAISFSAIKAIRIKNNSTTGTLVVGGEATNGFSALFGANEDVINIPPGGVFIIACDTAAGFAVAADEVLQIANSDGANALEYEIQIAGNE